MRIATLVVVVSSLGGSAHADHRKDRYLSATEVTAVVAPYSDEIERCYLERAGQLRRTAQLDVTFAIARDGRVRSLRAATTGDTRKATTAKVEDCIRGLVELLQFPVRRSETTAVAPFVFHKAEAANAGPQLSCWKVAGC